MVFKLLFLCNFLIWLLGKVLTFKAQMFELFQCFHCFSMDLLYSHSQPANIMNQQNIALSTKILLCLPKFCSCAGNHDLLGKVKFPIFGLQNLVMAITVCLHIHKPHVILSSELLLICSCRD